MLSLPLFSGRNIDTPKGLRSLAQRCSRSGLRWVRRTLLRTYPGRVAQGRCPPVPASSFIDVLLITFEAVLRPGDIHAVTTPPKLSSPKLPGFCNLTRTSIQGGWPAPDGEEAGVRHQGAVGKRQSAEKSRTEKSADLSSHFVCHSAFRIPNSELRTPHFLPFRISPGSAFFQL